MAPVQPGGTLYGHRAGRLPQILVPGRLRTVIVERMVRNEFRTGLQAVLGRAPSGPGDPFRFQGCGTAAIGRIRVVVTWTTLRAAGAGD